MPEPWTIERAAREKPPIFHPLAGSNFKTFWRHYLGNRPFDARSRAQRTIGILASSIRTPFYALKKLRAGDKIASHEPGAPPIFIIGHWRSGTTHLHNILSQDPQFAWITLHQTGNPWSMAGTGIGLVRHLMQMVIPETRGMDNVEFSLDSPQEEEMALGNMNPLCYYNCYYFPRELRRHFSESILFENVSDEALAEFADAYRTLAQRLSFANGGRRLLFKNPPSTARIRFLKDAFPGAKFIHIVRNPYTVFSSTVAHYARVMNAFSWHKFDDIDYESITIENYRLLMQRYLAQKDDLGNGDLVEVRFEDLIASPRRVIEEIYTTLAIPGGETALTAIEHYVASLAGYQKNPHALSRAQVDRIQKEWAFALDHWRYDLPANMPLTD